MPIVLIGGRDLFAGISLKRPGPVAEIEFDRTFGEAKLANVA